MTIIHPVQWKDQKNSYLEIHTLWRRTVLTVCCVWLCYNSEDIVICIIALHSVFIAHTAHCTMCSAFVIKLWITKKLEKKNGSGFLLIIIICFFFSRCHFNWSFGCEIICWVIHFIFHIVSDIRCFLYLSRMKNRDWSDSFYENVCT